MKRIFIYIFLILPLISCEDFLEEESKDLLIPKTLENYEELLYGEVIRDRVDHLVFLQFLSDDVREYFSGSQYEQRSFAAGYFKWSSEPEFGMKNEYFPNKCWDEFYRDIFTCNVMIDNVIGLQVNDEKKKNNLLGEIYFMRALRYFYLVNIFGEPYLDHVQAETALGIPINDKNSIEEVQYKRLSLKKCYELIKEDIKKSIEFFNEGESKNTVFRPNINAAYILASRIFLYCKDYENCIKNADKVIANKINDIPVVEQYPSKVYFFNVENKGVTFSYGSKSLGVYGAFADSPYFFYNGYYVSDDILNLYSDNDKRKVGFFGYYNLPNKYVGSKNTLCGKNIRIEEALLNRAEAKLMLDINNIESAIEDINVIRSKRIFDIEYRVNADEYEEALQKIRDERRMELCFEFTRWFDMRRWQLTANHEFTENGVASNYNIKAGDKNYTLPIPKHIRDINSVIERLY